MSQELINASPTGSLEEMKTLNTIGCDLNYRGRLSNTALGYCAGEWQIEIISLPLLNGSDPNVPGFNGHSADPNQMREEIGETPLHCATARGQLPGHMECVKALLEGVGLERRRDDQSADSLWCRCRSSGWQRQLARGMGCWQALAARVDSSPAATSASLESRVWCYSN